MNSNTQRRIELTRDIMDHFFDEVFHGEVSEFSAHKRLPYSLVYNLVHGRINSLSADDYRRIFGEDPPERDSERVSGDYFRGMVRLWFFLNDDATGKDLYREFYRNKKSVKKTDYRIFTRAIKTVERRFERMMEQKFMDQGLERTEIKSWIREMDLFPDQERVPYEKAKPILGRLEKTLNVHPTRLLNRWIASYESGYLKTISRELYDKLQVLDGKAQALVQDPSRLKLEKLLEEIYGSREGLTLFSEVEEELDFLRSWGRHGPKRYLGRGLGKYRRSKLKRIASWRLEKIREDCEKVIKGRPDIRIMFLPKRYRTHRLKLLVDTLASVVVGRMLSEEAQTCEEDVLRPVYYTKMEYENRGHRYVTVEEGARILGMSEKAFGLVMAKHSDIFKRIGKYEKRWLIPDLYLIVIAQKHVFSFVRAKYEWLAKEAEPLRSSRKDSWPLISLEFSPIIGQDLESPGRGGVA